MCFKPKLNANFHTHPFNMYRNYLDITLIKKEIKSSHLNLMEGELEVYIADD